MYKKSLHSFFSVNVNLSVNFVPTQACSLSNSAVIKSCICIICFREELLVMEGTQKQARATFVRESTRNGERLCFQYLK